MGEADSGGYAVRVSDLTRRFGDFVAVDRVSFSVPRGEIFGFLGANGAGKTTTIRMLCGLLMPSSGSGTVADYDVMRDYEKIKLRHRLHESEVQPLRGPHGTREHGVLRRDLRAAARRTSGTEHRGAAGLARARARRPTSSSPACPWAGSSVWRWRCPHPRSRDRLPRRADERGRSGLAPQFLAADLPARRSGQDRVRDHRITWTRRNTAAAYPS